MCVHSLSTTEGADYLQLPADIIDFGIDAANGSKLGMAQLVVSKQMHLVGDVTWKDGNETNLVHQPLLQHWVLFECSDHHLLPGHPHAANNSQYSAR